MSITHLNSALTNKVKLSSLVQEYRREIETEVDDNFETLTRQPSKSNVTYNKSVQYGRSIFSNLYNYMKSAPLPVERNVPTKTVKFSRLIQIFLIPCKREFDDIKHLAWYNSNEIRNIRKEATLEMKEFREIHKCTLKYGVCMLYQPSNTNEELIKEMK